VATAREAFAGTPYQWGGITPWGADCSGFVQTVYAVHGIQLPRDASQQALIGAEADGEVPGDLLFFSERDDGRITHVAIALGPSEFAHVALGRGGHAVERRNNPDAYVTALLARFKFATRVTSASAPYSASGPRS
jgi:cell wall-associated NlpC family hydrolase